MCGRYTLVVDGSELWEELGLEGSPEPIDSRYNIAPTQQAPVVGLRQGAPRPRLVRMRWGLVPSWADDPSVGARMINVRSETAAQKPAFRRALEARRCLVPATGFFEWKPEGRVKTPYLITSKGESLMTLAGLWERWLTPTRERVFSFAILTQAASSELEQLHSRMPVVVPAEARVAWLDAASAGPAQLARLVEANSDAAEDAASTEPRFDLQRLTRRVSSVEHDDPECLAPAQEQT